MYLPTILTLDGTVSWLLTSGLKVAGVLLAAWVVSRLLKTVIARCLKSFIEKGLNGLRAQKVEIKLEEERLKTLQKVSLSVLKTAIWLIAIITILPELGINIGPLLAGLGVGGLALGFGARSLIQDYISGLFILIEDHYRVGELVEAAGTKGTIKNFNLRRTVIEDEEGTLHFLPNNQIKKASNFSRK